MITNLSWPQTPYGADKRPFARHVQLLTGLAMQWVDDGTAGVPASVAVVFLPVRRTQAVQLTPQTLHFGYRLAVAERNDDAPELLRLIDGILVQGRRHAAGIAWHSFADDLHVTQALAIERLPGFTALGEAWRDRSQRERGTAPLVDTATDLGMYALTTQAAKAQGLELGPNLATFQDTSVVQTSHEQLTAEEGDGELLVQELAAGILGQALTVALLGGRTMNRITWQAPFDVAAAVGLEAWHVLPLLYDAESPTASAPSQ
ncbi:hypothetical protein [Streptomyces mayteni]